MHDFIASIPSLLYMTIRLCTPILLAAEACAITKKAGLLNMGAEGLMLIAALMGVLFSAWTQSMMVGVICGVLSSVLITLIICFVSFNLKCDLNLTNISMNSILIGGTVFIMYVVCKQKSVTAGVLDSKTLPIVEIPLIKDIPILGDILSGHNVLTYIAVIMIVAVWFLLSKTVLGLRIRSVGVNAQAAQSVGISPKRIYYISYALSGLISGLGGVYMSMGYLSWFARDMMGGRGFMAMAAMNIAGGDPIATALNSLLFAGAQAVSIFSQRYKVNADLVLAFPYIFAVILITVLTLGKRNKEKKRQQRFIEARKQAEIQE